MIFLKLANKPKLCYKNKCKTIRWVRKRTARQTFPKIPRELKTGKLKCGGLRTQMRANKVCVSKREQSERNQSNYTRDCGHGRHQHFSPSNYSGTSCFASNGEFVDAVECGSAWSKARARYRSPGRLRACSNTSWDPPHVGDGRGRPSSDCRVGRGFWATRRTRGICSACWMGFETPRRKNSSPRWRIPSGIASTTSYASLTYPELDYFKRQSQLPNWIFSGFWGELKKRKWV